MFKYILTAIFLLGCASGPPTEGPECMWGKGDPRCPYDNFINIRPIEQLKKDAHGREWVHMVCVDGFCLYAFTRREESEAFVKEYKVLRPRKEWKSLDIHEYSIPINVHGLSTAKVYLGEKKEIKP